MKKEIGKELSDSISKSFIGKKMNPIELNDNDFEVSGIVMRLKTSGLFVSVNNKTWIKLDKIKPSFETFSYACYLLEERYTFA